MRGRATLLFLLLLLFLLENSSSSSLSSTSSVVDTVVSVVAGSAAAAPADCVRVVGAVAATDEVVVTVVDVLVAGDGDNDDRVAKSWTVGVDGGTDDHDDHDCLRVVVVDGRRSDDSGASVINSNNVNFGSRHSRTVLIVEDADDQVVVGKILDAGAWLRLDSVFVLVDAKTREAEELYQVTFPGSTVLKALSLTFWQLLMCKCPNVAHVPLTFAISYYVVRSRLNDPTSSCRTPRITLYIPTNSDPYTCK